jgi:alkylation response protein AidB-like acyl-CoA dehydrogenase
MSASTTLLARAHELESELRAGDCGSDLHERLARDGFHAMLVPRAAGGGAFELGDFVEVVSALARADAGSAWCTAALAAGTAATAESGLTPAACALLIAGTASAVSDGAGGWLISGTFHRCAGARAATHFAGEASDGDGEPVRFVAAAEQVRISGGGAACAATVVLDSAAIAAESVLGDGSTGTRAVVLPIGLAAVFAGAAARAAEIHTGLLAASPARAGDPDHQRWCGATITRAAAARTLLREALARPARVARSEATLGTIAQRALAYAWTAVAESARTAPTDDDGPRAELDTVARTLLELRADPSPLTEEELTRALARERLELADALA